MTTFLNLVVVIAVFIVFIHPQSADKTSVNVGDATLLLRPLTNTLSVETFNDPTINPCNWTGIKCTGSTLTRLHLPCPLSHPTLPFPTIITKFKSLTHLNLSRCAFTGQILPAFWDLDSLEVVDLSGNRLSGTLPPDIAGLKNLRRLILDFNDFSGRIPPEIGNLTELRELSFASNSFCGSLPAELGNLHRLISLDLSENFFSGDLPVGLTDLSNLRYLSVRDNGLSGRLPPEIGKLGTLRILELGWNKFTGNIPEEITMLQRLTRLDIAHNAFVTVLPPTIGRMVNLIYLLAQQSGIVGSIPSQLGDCKGLKIIDLSFNLLLGSLPDSLARLKSIDTVVVNSNALSGPIPPWISEWKQAKSIDLSRNGFTGLLPRLDLPLLFHLDMSANHLSGVLPEDICSGIPSLQFLLLSNNGFSGSIGDVFKNCRNLVSLVLSGNNLSGELPGYLGDLRLQDIELSMNQLSGRIPDHLWESKTLMGVSLCSNLLEGPLPEAIGNLSTLKKLLLDNNLFEGSIPSSIGKLKNLTNLSLYGNKLSGEIPLELLDCTNLVSLNLGKNGLKGRIPTSIFKLIFLDNLVLSNNNIEGLIPEEICTSFQKMSIPDSEFVQHHGMFDLSYNVLEGPIPPTIGRCIGTTEILLQGNNLNGSIPEEIAMLPNLALINLSYNSLSGDVSPWFFSMSNLQGLILSHNQLQGLIPDIVSSMSPSLSKIDLSYNALCGPLPPYLFTLKSLTYIDVSSNNLSGRLAIEINTASSLLLLNASNNRFSGRLDDSVSDLGPLSCLDLHNNEFSGSLPGSLADLPDLTYLDLSSNAFQNPFPCNICTIPGLMYANFSGNKFSNHFLRSCKGKSVCSGVHSVRRVLSRASIFGVATGLATIVILLSIAIVKLRNKRRHRICLDDDKDRLVVTPHRRSSDGHSMKKIKEPLSINVATFEHSLMRLTADDILSATENFSSKYVIGEGGFGIVYRALLPDGQKIAIKRLNGGHLHGEREFMAEIETLGKVQHGNLVPLLGYCVFSDERLLIYEFMENGNLDFWLRNDRTDALAPLDWPTRFKICLGSARGLAFLHNGFFPHIIHRDIKSSNILLDSNFEPRVSDFGLARLISECESHVSTALAGTFGYIPPEYGQAMVATTKGDVYSFGVVILELVTGQPPTGQTDGEGGNLVGWVRWMAAQSRIIEVVDPPLYGWKDEAVRVLEIGRACTDDEPGNRPTMMEVVGMLKKAKTRV